MRVAFPVAIVLGTTVFCWADEQDKGCDGSTYQMVECLKGKTDRWDKKLNVAYGKALKNAQPKQREQLRAAQRLWVQYRDANCLYWRLNEGTIAAIEAGDCMFRMTRDRAQELEGSNERN